MVITDVKADYVKFPLDGDFRPTWGSGLVMKEVGMTLVRIETDEGVCGVAAGTADGFENVVGIHTFIKRQLIGKNPLYIERLRPIITNAALRMGWPWMLEAALWDLAGKVCGLPVSQMWGAYTDRLPVYASTGELRSFEERRTYVQSCIDLGIKAVKLRMHSDDLDEDLDDIRALVREFGKKVSFMVDANQADSLPGANDIHRSWDVFTALKAGRALEELGILWLEEPLARHDLDGLAMLAQKLDIPIAGGEKNTGLHEFRHLAERPGYHILQGDCIFSEGMFQLRKAAALAEAHHKLFIPHTWSNPCGLFTNLQLAASLPNCPWFELPFDPPSHTLAMYTRIFKDPLPLQNGYIEAPKHPGLGFALQEDFLEKYRVPFSKESIGIEATI